MGITIMSIVRNFDLPEVFPEKVMNQAERYAPEVTEADREGRLDEVLSVLAGNDVNIVALSLADTTEYGMLRMIVSDPNKGKAVLKENGITAMLTDVIALRVPHETGSLSRAMHQIVDGDVNIEYMYAFANGEDASAVLKCDDPARVVDILRGSGFDVWEASEAYVSNIK